MYTPKKKTAKKIIIYLGKMNSKIGEIHVCISCSCKGNIDDIGFLFELEENRTLKNNKLLVNIAEIAKKRMNELYTYNVTYQLFCIHLWKKGLVIENYISEYFSISSKRDISYFSFNTLAYDIFDSEERAYKKLKDILAFLAAETNVLFELVKMDIKQDKQRFNLKKANSNKVFQEDIFDDGYAFIKGKFIDYYSIHDEKILLSRTAIKYIDRIVLSSNITGNFMLFQNSFNLFRQGLVMEYKNKSERFLLNNTEKQLCASKKEKGEGQENIISQAVTNYMSALENVTLIGYAPEKCEKCGQLKYAIGNRVEKIVENYFTEEMGKAFKKIYAMRSKYLHSGTKIATSSYSVVRPFLDVDTGTGCEDRTFISINICGESGILFSANIREWVSYILRQEYRNLLEESIE